MTLGLTNPWRDECAGQRHSGNRDCVPSGDEQRRIIGAMGRIEARGQAPGEKSCHCTRKTGTRRCTIAKHCQEHGKRTEADQRDENDA